eukprot:UN21965
MADTSGKTDAKTDSKTQKDNSNIGNCQMTNPTNETNCMFEISLILIWIFSTVSFPQITYFSF